MDKGKMMCTKQEPVLNEPLTAARDLVSVDHWQWGTACRWTKWKEVSTRESPQSVWQSVQISFWWIINNGVTLLPEDEQQQRGLVPNSNKLSLGRWQPTQISFGWIIYNRVLPPQKLASTGYREPDSKVHGANMGPTRVLSAPGGLHVGHMNFAIWGAYTDEQALCTPCTVR